MGQLVIKLDEKHINRWYLLDKAMVLKKSSTARKRVKAEEILKQIIGEEEADYQLSVLALLNLCELYITELEFTNGYTNVAEILAEVGPLINQLLDIAEKSHSYWVWGETHLFQAKLALISLNLEEARRFLTQGQKIAEKYGLEFLAKVKDQAYDVPFIIFTGKGREEVAIQALNLGADYYLQKGGDPKSQFRELINLIEKSMEKRKSDISVRKSEEKFSKAFQFSMTGIVIIRFTDQVILDVNNNFSKTVDYTKDEIVGKKIDELNLWARTEDNDFLYKQLIEIGEIIDFETLIVGKSGQIIPLQISATLIDIEGELCILLISRDISDLTQALEDSKENLLKYQTLFEESPIALFNLNMFAVKKTFEELNIATLQQFSKALKKQPKFLSDLILMIKILDVNRTAIELIGAHDKQDLLRYFQYENVEKNYDLYTKILNGLLNNKVKFEEEIEITRLTGDKAKVFLKISVAPKSENTWSKVFVSGINITKRALVEATLRKERQAFRIIADASNIAIDSLKEFCDKILAGLSNVLSFDHGSIRLLNKETMMLEYVSSVGITESVRKHLKPLSINDKNHNLVSRLLEKKIVYFPDVPKSSMKDSIFAKELEIASYIFCPLLDSSNSIIGSIQFCCKDSKEISDDDITFFESIAEILSSIFEQKLKKSQD